MDRLKALEILGIEEPLPSKKDIKKAFRRLMKEIHPDISDLDEKIAHEKAVEVNCAYEFLMQNPLAIEQELHEMFKEEPFEHRNFWTNSYYDYRARYNDFFVDQETDRYDALIINSKGMHVVLYHEKFGSEIKLYIPKPKFQKGKKWNLEKICNLFYSIVKKRGYSKEKTPYGWEVDEDTEQWGGWIFKKPAEKGQHWENEVTLENAHFCLFSPMEWKDENLEYLIPENEASIRIMRPFRATMSGSDHLEFTYKSNPYDKNKNPSEQIRTAYWTVLEKILGDVSLILIDPYFTWLPSINQITQIYGEPKKVRSPYGDYGNALFSFSINMGNQTEFIISENRYNAYQRGRRFHSPVSAQEARSILENELLHLRMKKNAITLAKNKS